MKSILSRLLGLVSSVETLPLAFRDLLMWPLATRVFGRDYTEKLALRDGFFMNGSMEDILSRKILFNGRSKRHLWEPATSALLEELSKKAVNILIAGSHIGYLVLLAAKNTEGKVWAFEPEPKLFTASRRNFTLNPTLDKKITLLPKALGDTEGNVDLYSEDIRSSIIPYSGGHAAHHNIINVPITTIDIEMKQAGAFDLILLDIEGYEWNALTGAFDALKSKPKLILEISPRVLAHTHVTPAMMWKKLTTLGYSIYFIDDYAPQTPLVAYSEEMEKHFLQRDYVNMYAVYE